MYYMFMEGSLNIPAVQYCDEESNLSCTDKLDRIDATTVDNQLTVTWYANAVITEGDYHTTRAPENGDHDFMCYTSCSRKLTKVSDENAFVSVRGIQLYLLSHA